MGLIAWSFADHCKKVIIWTTSFIADLLNEFSAQARRRLLGAEGRTPWRIYVGKLLANPEQFGEIKPGEVILVMSYLWTCICCARSRSGTCLFSLTPDMLPEWVGSWLPSFHIRSLFPNGSPTLWHSGMVTDFFLLVTPVIQLEASPWWDSGANACKQMNWVWAPPGLPKCIAHLCFLACPKPATFLTPSFRTPHPDFPSFFSCWGGFTLGEWMTFSFSKSYP